MTAVEPTMPTNTPTTSPRSRRDVLCGLMVALVAPGALVAACSSDDSGGGTDNGSGNGSGNGGGTSAPGGTAAGLTALSAVPDGGGVVVESPDGGMLLIVRDGDQVKAYNAACTHKGTTVEAPTDGVATCPNHGSQFDTATGEATKGPATDPLPTVAVKVEGDQVVLA